MTISEGSIIRISRPHKGWRWKANTIIKLPGHAEAVCVRKDGGIVLVLSNSLVLVNRSNRVQTLLADAPWRLLYCNSAVRSEDEQKLWIGMRQFVGEFDFEANKLRLLIPTAEWLNKLSDAEVEQLRKVYQLEEGP
jgi:hypothetical protein